MSSGQSSNLAALNYALAILVQIYMDMHMVQDDPRRYHTQLSTGRKSILTHTHIQHFYFFFFRYFNKDKQTIQEANRRLSTEAMYIQGTCSKPNKTRT